MSGEINQTPIELSGSSDLAAQAHTQPPRVMGFADLVMFYVVTGISLRWIATAASAECFFLKRLTIVEWARGVP